MRGGAATAYTPAACSTGPGPRGAGHGGFRHDMQRENRDARDALRPELGDAIDDILSRGRDGKGRQMGGCLPFGADRGR